MRLPHLVFHSCVLTLRLCFKCCFLSRQQDKTSKQPQAVESQGHPTYYALKKEVNNIEYTASCEAT